MNPFSMMMAASRAVNKKEEVVAIKPDIVKRKVGRPPAAKDVPPIIVPFPVVDLTATTIAAVSRKNYDIDDSKIKMDMALQVVLKSKGKHTRRTALIYGVSVKSLVIRYKAAVKALSDFVPGNKIKTMPRVAFVQASISSSL
jgi:hypothetical protein